MCLGIPGQIVEIVDATTNIAVADVSGVRRNVNVTCVMGGGIDDLVGKWVLIHVGFAMALIDEDEARKTMETLIDLGEAQEEFEAMFAGDRAVAGRA
ncbi:HypC/HybG/HupF family hydrogenase formation chaperone [Ovoidimarina sediminis]|uniref:HypC/HybG/HupF family hydrogenase formation chaperone n=1 Tax=Ovoidimarina sediminis TaxID=3079856 RepID=UPI002913D6E0|nr:HypC/HybG/HupF family hydrogenase formation chaperone [Rhodophyticola sp. MJ-SS7]MDU8944309.1 HypC/HybG/HupF family hydrogenase formation chaperone [Rhodophyticola sp. MJ-SS7]